MRPTIDQLVQVLNSNPRGCNQHKKCGGSVVKVRQNGLQLFRRRKGLSNWAATATETADAGGVDNFFDHKLASRAHRAAAYRLRHPSSGVSQVGDEDLAKIHLKYAKAHDTKYKTLKTFRRWDPKKAAKIQSTPVQIDD